jgi:hypothetical protein
MRLIFLGITVLAALQTGCVVPNASQIREGQSPPVMASDADTGALLVRSYPGYCDYGASGAGIPPVAFAVTYSCTGAVAISDDGSAVIHIDKGAMRIVRLSGGEEALTFDPHPYSSPFLANYMQQRVAGRFIANYDTAIDMRTGDVRRIAQPAKSPAPVYREVSRTPEGVATLQAPRPARLGPAVGFPEWQAQIIPDPNGGQDILMHHGAASVPYSDPDLPSPVRMRLSDLQPAPPPGPDASTLAPLVEIREYARPSAQFNEPYTLKYKGYGKGFGHPFLYAPDGSLSLWGLYSGTSGADIGFGVFRYGQSEPLWTMMFKGAPPTLTFDKDGSTISIRDHVGSVTAEGREPMIRRYNALTGELTSEIKISSLPTTSIQQATPMRQFLPPSLEPFRVAAAPSGPGPEYITQLDVLVSLEPTQPGNGAQLVVREGKAGTVIWQKKLEETVTSGRSRRAAFDAAETTPRIAVLSTDGNIRVFDYGDALKP